MQKNDRNDPSFFSDVSRNITNEYMGFERQEIIRDSI